MADKKGRKVGRNKTSCAAYRAANRKPFNKARRLIRYLRKHPEKSECAWVALEKAGAALFSAQRSALGLSDFMKGRP